MLGREDCQVANSSKTPTTETVQMITRNDKLPLTGGPQILTTKNVGDWCAAVLYVQWSCSMKRPIHQHGELVSYSVCDVEPVIEFIVCCDKPLSVSASTASMSQMRE